MCVIVVKKANKSIPVNVLQDMWAANPDGAGIAMVHSGKVMIIKGMLTFEELASTVDEFKHKTLLIHLRLATSGRRDMLNTHPFYVGDSAVMHNGCLPSWSYDNVKSDTRLFCENVLSHVPREEWPRILKTVGGKWAILSPDRLQLIGQFDKWDGLRVSNTYWRFDFTSTKSQSYAPYADRDPWSFRE